MIKQELRPGVFVRHRSESKYGIGKVASLRENDLLVEVEFQNESGSQPIQMEKDSALRSLVILPDDGLEVAFWNSPETVKSWVSGGQLRLLATALVDLGGSGKVRNIKSKLERVIEEGGEEVSSWWDKVRPAVQDSNHFTTEKSRPIVLLANVADVPVEPVATRPRTATGRGQSNRAEYQKQLDDQRTEHRKQLDDQRTEHRKQLDDQRTEHRKQLDDQRTERQKLLDDQRTSYEMQLNEQRRSYEMRLEQLHQQNQTFRAQMASGREESRLEVRQGMLLEMADILQRACRQARSPEDRLHDVIARIPVALQAGGADTLGTVGDTVPYDPKLHHATEAISSGTLVRLSAPGVVVRGGSFGERVILKANVTQQPEVSKCKLSA